VSRARTDLQPPHDSHLLSRTVLAAPSGSVDEAAAACTWIYRPTISRAAMRLQMRSALYRTVHSVDFIQALLAGSCDRLDNQTAIWMGPSGRLQMTRTVTPPAWC
jgi:hypothetical protein